MVTWAQTADSAWRRETPHYPRTETVAPGVSLREDMDSIEVTRTTAAGVERRSAWRTHVDAKNERGEWCLRSQWVGAAGASFQATYELEFADREAAAAWCRSLAEQVQAEAV